MSLDFQDRVRFGYVEPEDSPTEPDRRCKGTLDGEECPGVLPEEPTKVIHFTDEDGDVYDCMAFWNCPVCGRQHAEEDLWG